MEEGFLQVAKECLSSIVNLLAGLAILLFLGFMFMPHKMMEIFKYWFYGCGGLFVLGGAVFLVVVISDYIKGDNDD